MRFAGVRSRKLVVTRPAQNHAAIVKPDSIRHESVRKAILVKPPSLTAGLSRAARSPHFWAVTIILGKVLVCLPFSSDYVDVLFYPFLETFVTGILAGQPVNPWAASIATLPDAFPYHPGMLYLYGAAILPTGLLPGNLLWLKLWFVLPAAAADAMILFTLLRFFPERRWAINILYGLSPILFYSIYLHGQLDLWPTALLFLSCYFLIRRGPVGAAVLMGLAVSMKLHVAAALPLIVVFLYRRRGLLPTARFLLGFGLTFGVLSLPWYLDESFRGMVLQNPKQDLLFQAARLENGQDPLYISLLVILLIYMRFFAYRKINADLFFSWMACLFAVFVLIIPPAPGWYAWIVPLLTYFYLKFVRNDRHLLYLSGFLAAAYLAYFVLVWQGDYVDLALLGEPLQFKLTSIRTGGVLYTVLQAALLANLLYVYRFGVRSNAIYRRPGPILIGIGGDSGAGKSTLKQSFHRLLAPSITTLEGDAEHRWERGDPNWDDYTHLNPRANFLRRQADFLHRLKTGEAILRSDYQHSTGRFSPARFIRPADFIILSGLHPFYLPRMRKLIDIKIFLDTDEPLRRHWKIQRDHAQRGHPIAKIEEQLRTRARDAERFIHPQKGFADMVIEYRPAGDLSPERELSPADLRLRITLQADLHIEEMVHEMEKESWLEEWDYLDSLRGQFFSFAGAPGPEQLQSFARRFVDSYTDLFPSEPHWDAGYPGIIQLFVVVMIDHCLKEAPNEATAL